MGHVSSPKRVVRPEARPRASASVDGFIFQFPAWREDLKKLVDGSKLNEV